MSLKWNENGKNKEENGGEDEALELDDKETEEKSCTLPKKEERECEGCT